MKIYHAILVFNLGLLFLVNVAYSYQFYYTMLGLFYRKVKPEREASRLRTYAALICARNEESVITELIESLKAQKYPSDLLDIYVLADNCTDNTASVAEKAGASVYRREDHKHVGKGYALNYLLNKITGKHGFRTYDGFFIFDADNLVDPGFVSEMNKTFDRGYEVVTCYRNSKNFGMNWITAGYSIWFLREARFLNYPRMLLGTTCAISGTGFLVSSRIVEENGGWPFYLLTEDIQFTVDCVLKDRRIGYCDSAVVYDEQPTTFSQSWHQRRRWSRGFYQINLKYLIPLVKGIFTSGKSKLPYFDFLLTVIPCVLMVLGIILLGLNTAAGLLIKPYGWIEGSLRTFLIGQAFAAVVGYLGMTLYGALIVACEWKRIRATRWQKLKYLWLFPLFMATYIPITLAALSRNVGWTPIVHYPSRSLDITATGKRG